MQVTWFLLPSHLDLDKGSFKDLITLKVMNSIVDRGLSKSKADWIDECSVGLDERRVSNMEIDIVKTFSTIPCSVYNHNSVDTDAFAELQLNPRKVVKG